MRRLLQTLRHKRERKSSTWKIIYIVHSHPTFDLIVIHSSIKMKPQLFSLCLAAGISASPVQLSTGQCTTKIDKFDDLTSSPVPFLFQNDIGAYNGLLYGRFAAMGATGLNGVAPKSPNNTAGVGLTRTLTAPILDFLTGAGSTIPVTLSPFGTISAPAGKYFDLVEFYFGCRLNAVATVVVPAVRCDFSATGFNYLDQPCLKSLSLMRLSLVPGLWVPF
ncbi:uncharacterized protein RHO25_005963 [Cercospora beticola]|uniref:Uncharacterized protein n=2 Tax=Cercospora beticola TaxID=122368 RepID=A0ABZ0NPD2_CERBT|nr:hypothetical protein RHO25_005963 [Cercospora beticola]